MKISRLIPLALASLLFHLSSASDSDVVSKEEQIEGEDEHRISKRFIHLISHGPDGEGRTEGKRVWDKHLRNALKGGKVKLVLDMEKPKKFFQRIMRALFKRRNQVKEWWEKKYEGFLPPDENGFVPPLDEDGNKFPPLSDDGRQFPPLNDEDVEDKARPHHKFPVLRRPPIFKLDSKEADDDMMKDDEKKTSVNEGNMAWRPPAKNEGDKVWRPPVKDDGKVWRPPVDDKDGNKVWRPPVEANEEDRIWRPPSDEKNKVWRPPVDEEDKVWRPPANDGEGSMVRQPPMKDDGKNRKRQPPVNEEASRKWPSSVDEETEVESEEKDNNVDLNETDERRNSNREELDVDARNRHDDKSFKNLFKDI